MQNWHQIQMCYLFPFTAPIKEAARKGLSGSPFARMADDFSDIGCSVYIIPTSSLSFFPRLGPKPNKELWATQHLNNRSHNQRWTKVDSWLWRSSQPKSVHRCSSLEDGRIQVWDPNMMDWLHRNFDARVKYSPDKTRGTAASSYLSFINMETENWQR